MTEPCPEIWHEAKVSSGSDSAFSAAAKYNTMAVAWRKTSRFKLKPWTCKLY